MFVPATPAQPAPALAPVGVVSAAPATVRARRCTPRLKVAARAAERARRSPRRPSTGTLLEAPRVRRRAGAWSRCRCSAGRGWQHARARPHRRHAAASGCSFLPAAGSAAGCVRLRFEGDADGARRAPAPRPAERLPPRRRLLVRRRRRPGLRRRADQLDARRRQQDAALRHARDAALRRPHVRVPVVDRGPYVAGREFDLTEATKQALGFGDTGRRLEHRACSEVASRRAGRSALGGFVQGLGFRTAVPFNHLDVPRHEPRARQTWLESLGDWSWPGHGATPRPPRRSRRRGCPRSRRRPAGAGAAGGGRCRRPGCARGGCCIGAAAERAGGRLRSRSALAGPARASAATRDVRPPARAAAAAPAEPAAARRRCGAISADARRQLDRSRAATARPRCARQGSLLRLPAARLCAARRERRALPGPLPAARQQPARDGLPAKSGCRTSSTA